MANKNAPIGLVPTKCDGRIRTNEYDLISTNAEIGVGSVLAQNSAGGLDLWTSGAHIGVAAEYKAANSGGTIKVYDDPEQEFVAQTDDGTGTATSQTAIGLNITIVNNATVDAALGLSRAELDESSAASGATLPFKIRKLYPAVDNAFGEFNRLVVVPNNHVLKGGTGTAGV